ncbi:glutaredoxin domain-containing protein [Ditylenchus destructor]|uniref:Glutaredoxin-1 n=1 Tax=Ditylenchus destructor TaxID=166010 RepID=A0AAD4QSH8_9BILA|nr:glutaredoxin domain-containing protein [Ditylenchus destructor]
MSQVKKFVDDVIASNKVAVFSKSFCPFCQKAKDAINSFNLAKGALKWLEIESHPDMDEIQDYLKELTGDRTVPQVFIGGKFLGGGDDSEKAKKDGSLEKKLEEVGALFKPNKTEKEKTAIKKYVDHWLGYKRVCTFLDAKCPHCRQVKAAVDGLNFARGRGGNIIFIEIEYRDDNEDFREYLRELSGQRTLPQLFLDGTFYGDGDKVLAAVADGTFEKKVREVGAL